MALKPLSLIKLLWVSYMVMCESVETIPKGSTFKWREALDTLRGDDIVRSI